MPTKNDFPDWLTQAIIHLSSIPADLRHQELLRVIGRRIHQSLQIMEAEKYATPETRFEFVFSGATEEDLAKIRSYLTPFENSVVHLKSHPATSSNAPPPKITQL